jgi:hypothetical protein
MNFAMDSYPSNIQEEDILCSVYRDAAEDKLEELCLLLEVCCLIMFYSLPCFCFFFHLIPFLCIFFIFGPLKNLDSLCWSLPF